MVTHHTNDGAIHLDVDTPSRHAPLDGFPEPPAWMEDAVCASTDPEAFFPEKGGSTREAKNVCLSCSVQAECLDWALDHDERFGIWGGLSERQRRRIKPAPSCPDCGVTVPRAGLYCNLHQPAQRKRLVVAPGLPARVRLWAGQQGIRVQPIGNLPRSVVEDYLAAHPDDEQHQPAIHEESA